MPDLAWQADERALGDRGPRRHRRTRPARSVRTRAPFSVEPHLAVPRAAARQHRRDGDGTEAQGNRPHRRLDRASGVRRMTTDRSEEHTSELQSLMRISYAVLCLKKNTKQK